MSIEMKGVGHVVILVEDIQKSLKFYTEVLGGEVTNHLTLPGIPERSWISFGENHHDIVLAQAPEGVQVGLEVEQQNRHIQQIAFPVADAQQFYKALAHLLMHDVPIIEGPLVHGIESVLVTRDVAPGDSGSRSFYFKDPDGNILEIFTNAMTRSGHGEKFLTEQEEAALEAFMEERRPETFPS